MKEEFLTERLRSWLRLPEALLVGSFGGVILLGAGLLTLPWAQVAGNVSFLDALFTATSSVCVTGLVVVDTGTAYTLFGQTVILLLIQAGGLGIMTFAALLFQLLGRRLSLKTQAVVHGSFFQQDIGVNFKKIFRQILVITAVTEITGVLLLFLVLLWRSVSPAEAFFSALFHAISAFCNAGFSIYQDNLMGLRGCPVFISTVMLLIVIGGLGHTVVRELWDLTKARLFRQESEAGPPRLSVHARVVLLVSGGLIALGTLGLLVLGLTSAETTWMEKVSGALFQSLTPRTAGFNTVEIRALPLSSLLLLVLLMFVGGSPASCAGGLKTTALAIFLADLRARLLGEEEARLLGRRVPRETQARVSLLLRLAVLWNLLGVLFLLVTEGGRLGVGLHDVLFEQISAFGTVGLSTGITPQLSATGRLWVIATMFVGRLGPLTLAVWIFPKPQIHIRYPEGRIMIG